MRENGVNERDIITEAADQIPGSDDLISEEVSNAELSEQTFDSDDVASMVKRMSEVYFSRWERFRYESTQPSKYDREVVQSERRVVQDAIDCFRQLEGVELPELLGEVLRSTMGKAEDINQPGIAVAGIKNGNHGDQEGEATDPTRTALIYGILGSENMSGVRDFSEHRENWAENVRNRDALHAQIYFNIVGRGLDRIERNFYSSRGHSYIFNIDDFSELPAGTLGSFGPEKESKFQETKDTYELVFGKRFVPRQHSYAQAKDFGSDFYGPVQIFSEISGRKIQRRSLGVDPEDGFVTTFRIPPRRFEGVVVRKGSTAQEVQDLVAMMVRVYAERPELIIPVYDVYGSMLWPKRIFYPDLLDAVKDRPTKLQTSEAINIDNIEEVAKTELSKEELVQLLEAHLLYTEKTGHFVNRHLPKAIMELIPEYISREDVQFRIVNLIFNREFDPHILQHMAFLVTDHELIKVRMEQDPELIGKYLAFWRKRGKIDIEMVSQTTGFDQDRIAEILQSQDQP